MTFSKAWLEKKIMCGLCNFGCCNHQNFHVEITEEEQEKYRKENHYLSHEHQMEQMDKIIDELSRIKEDKKVRVKGLEPPCC